MTVILGVTGCIAAYKAALILRLLQREGVAILPVMTRAATRFLGSLTLEKLSGNRVVSDMGDTRPEEIEHISLARRSDLLLVAPATANILAKFSAGIGDDFLSTLYLSTTTPVVVAPAMNVEMWRHPATRRNLEILRGDGVVVVEPGAGYQACGEYGEGRLAEPERVAAEVLRLLRRSRRLEGLKVLVTAGPTVEDIDPVRFVSNRSSGRMGYAVAKEAARRGASVYLVTGPTSLPLPQGVEAVRVRSAAEMADAVLSLYADMHVVVKAAAVADYRPPQRLSRKLKKNREVWTLNLEPTRDILEELAARKKGQILVGFAAESEDLERNAAEKLRRKSLDLVVANDISETDAGFDSDTNRVLFIDRRENIVRHPLLPKNEVAQLLWDRVEEFFPKQPEPYPEASSRSVEP
jgi:phosphopantothenoylcysteine decarboxylase / phosphopantothenate---cysteine ligase